MRLIEIINQDTSFKLLKPFKLTAFYRDYCWGGELLKTEYGKRTDSTPLAESWELSANQTGSSVISSGELSGILFSDFVRDYPQLCGAKGLKSGEFPVLIKLIDAREMLSVQVHPDDEYARSHENSPGKTEMWIVLQSEPGAYVYCGFNKDVTPAEAEARISNHTITDILRVLPVRRGDVVFIPAGTVHAAGAGIVFAEIQQNSDITYRLYDHGRTGLDGKERPLHIHKALEAAVFGPVKPEAPGFCELESVPDYRLTRLAQCDYFNTEQLTLSGCYTGNVGRDSFCSVLCCEGDATLHCGGETLCVTKGECLFIPAGSGKFTLSGIGWFLFTTVS